MADTYTAVRRAAEQHDTTDTSRTWALADAVLAHIPSNGHGGDRRSDQAPTRGDLNEQLAELAHRLMGDGITTPKGESYTPSYLRTLRDMAMSWPLDERFAECAFRTHQQAGDSKIKRGVLLALVRVARGEKVRRPEHCGPTEWEDATGRVRTARHGFRVNANDLRIALAQKPNAGVQTGPDAARAVDNAGAKATAAALSRAQRAELREALDDEDATDDATEAAEGWEPPAFPGKTPPSPMGPEFEDFRQLLAQLNTAGGQVRGVERWIEQHPSCLSTPDWIEKVRMHLADIGQRWEAVNRLVELITTGVDDEALADILRGGE